MPALFKVFAKKKVFNVSSISHSYPRSPALVGQVFDREMTAACEAGPRVASPLQTSAKNISDLPPEIKLMIIRYLHPFDVLSLQKHRPFYGISCNDPQTWRPYGVRPITMNREVKVQGAGTGQKADMNLEADWTEGFLGMSEIMRALYKSWRMSFDVFLPLELPLEPKYEDKLHASAVKAHHAIEFIKKGKLTSAGHNIFEAIDLAHKSGSDFPDSAYFIVIRTHLEQAAEIAKHRSNKVNLKSLECSDALVYKLKFEMPSRNYFDIFNKYRSTVKKIAEMNLSRYFSCSVRSVEFIACGINYQINSEYYNELAEIWRAHIERGMRCGYWTAIEPNLRLFETLSKKANVDVPVEFFHDAQRKCLNRLFRQVKTRCPWMDVLKALRCAEIFAQRRGGHIPQRDYIKAIDIYLEKANAPLSNYGLSSMRKAVRLANAVIVKRNIPRHDKIIALAKNCGVDLPGRAAPSLQPHTAVFMHENNA